MNRDREAAVAALQDKYFPPATHPHPYRVFRDKVVEHIKDDSVVLEVGCGRTAPILTSIRERGGRLIGIDVVPFAVEDPRLELHNCSVTFMDRIASSSVDVAFSRSVMEHISDVHAAYREISRVLSAGGVYVFLTPNFWDYGSLISYATPNRLHGRIVSAVEGRMEDDVFPTFYRSNTKNSIARLAAASRLDVQQIRYIGQYPNYFLFSPTLFRIGCWYAKLIEKFQLLHPLQGWILCVLRKP